MTMPDNTAARRRIRWLFVTVFAGLCLQLPLRLYTEPYPAVLLPSGAHVIRSPGGVITGHDMEFLAEDAAGAEHAVSVDALLHTVPCSHRDTVARRGFGLRRLEEVRQRTVSVLGWHWTVQYRRSRTPVQLETTRAWLRQELRRLLGIEAVRLHVDTWAVTTMAGGPAGGRRSFTARDTVELLAGAN